MKRQPDPLLAALLAAQQHHQFFPQPAGAPIVVAVSGGADSVCLLHALHTLAPAWDLHLHVAHIDHALRAGSAGDARFVAALAATLGLPYHATILNPQALTADRAGLEAAARQARYQFLHTIALSVTPAGQIPRVAVAHHADDQAETLLMRLLQGSGLRGLGGMRPLVALPAPTHPSEPAVVLVRPLLGVRRAEILAYLERHHLAWRQDETNLDSRFVRNRVRHQIMPLLEELNPNLTATLARTAALLAAEAERATALDLTQVHALVTEPISADRIVLDLARWRALSLASRRGTLRAALETFGLPERAIHFDLIETLIDHISPHPLTRSPTPPPSSGPHPLIGEFAWSIMGTTREQPARLSLHRAQALPIAVDHPLLPSPDQLPVPIDGNLIVGDWVLHTRVLAPAELPADWRHNQDPWRLFADAGAVGDPVLATPQPGQSLEPLGMAGHHKQVADLFTDRKTPPAVRAGWPLLVDRTTGRVLWVCGSQPSEQVRITSQTRQVVCFWWAPARQRTRD